MVLRQFTLLLPMIFLQALATSKLGANDIQEDDPQTNSNSTDSGQNSCSGRGCSDAGWSNPEFIFFLISFGIILSAGLVAGCLRVVELCSAIRHPSTEDNESNNAHQIAITLQGQSTGV